MPAPPRPYVREWTGPGGPTIVCLHAVGGSHAHWNEVAPELATHGRTLAVDLVGFGRTPASASGAGLDGNQAMISRLLQENGRAILVGSSFGGAVALLQAAREPGSVAGLILSGSLLPAIDSAGRSVRASLIRRRLRQRIESANRAVRAIADGSLRLRRDSILAHAIRSNAADPSSIDAVIIAASVAAAGRRGIGPTMRVVAQAGGSSFSLWTHPERFARVLDRVTCPVLVIHGAHDRTIPISHAVAAARAHPDWRLHVFDHVGHLPHMEDTKGWISVVDEWVRTLGATT